MQIFTCRVNPHKSKGPISFGANIAVAVVVHSAAKLSYCHIPFKWLHYFVLAISSVIMKICLTVEQDVLKLDSQSSIHSHSGSVCL